MMKEGIPLQPIPLDDLRCLMAVLTLSAEMRDTDTKSEFTKGGEMPARENEL